MFHNQHVIGNLVPGTWPFYIMYILPLMIVLNDASFSASKIFLKILKDTCISVVQYIPTPDVNRLVHAITCRITGIP